jgi:hypothetical protein
VLRNGGRRQFRLPSLLFDGLSKFERLTPIVVAGYLLAWRVIFPLGGWYGAPALQRLP